MDYFHVPHADKDQAKALGARFSVDLKLWYAPTAPVSERLATRWARAIPPEPVEVFPGEDRDFGGDVRLAVAMTPSTCRNTGVESCVSREDWKRIRLGVVNCAHRHCEICRQPPAPEIKVYLDVQERYTFEDGRQVLKRLVCACSHCALFSQFGWAMALGQEAAARHHLLTVNGWTGSQLEDHLRQAYAAWAERSRQDWELDLSIVEAAGIVVRLPSLEERRQRGVDLNRLQQ